MGREPNLNQFERIDKKKMVKMNLKKENRNPILLKL